MVADDGNKIKGLKFDGLAGLTAEIRWKGSRSNALRALRNREKRNYTRKEILSADGIVQWDEEFRAVCAFSGSKDGSFEAWEVAFVSDGKLSTKSEDSMSTFTFDTDSVDGSDGRDSDKSWDDDHNVQKSFGYKTLAGANLASEALGLRTYEHDEDFIWFYVEMND
ncbi:hypothetical protein Nepgr_002746 [Nepenthes gracilis]|uniref:C2 NT-type domain-containing protein n=1 Tax=Nepenthes gracilis TaxID=150966 RepID=A0AAD3PAA3_NEPGR|nr:hypothetical protein Nepgr_002746 [Nepenthes gracilis]